MAGFALIGGFALEIALALEIGLSSVATLISDLAGVW